MGSYDSELGSSIDSTAMTWSTPTGMAPFSRIVPKLINYDNPVVIIVSVISALNIAFSLFCFVMFVIHKEKPVIKRSSPIFCNLILFGLILVWISLFMWAGNQTQGLCNAKIWVGAVGFSLVMGNLLAKNYRIWRIFDNDKLRSRVITNKELLYFSGIIVGIEIILVGVLMHDPLQPVVLKSSTSILYQYQACNCSNTSFQTIMTWIIFGYNLLLVIIGSVLAYLTRKVISSFNESKFIAVSMYNLFVCLAVIAPIYFTSGDAEGIEVRLYIVRSFAVLFSTTIILLALFAPKIRTLIKDANKEDHATNRTSENESKKYLSTRPNNTTMIARPFAADKKNVKQPATLEKIAKTAEDSEEEAEKKEVKKEEKAPTSDL